MRDGDRGQWNGLLPGFGLPKNEDCYKFIHSLSGDKRYPHGCHMHPLHLRSQCVTRPLAFWRRPLPCDDLYSGSGGLSKRVHALGH